MDGSVHFLQHHHQHSPEPPQLITCFLRLDLEPFHFPPSEMQFFTLTTVFFAVASGVLAAPAPIAGAPEPSHLQARTCGTLTGKPLQLCQGACKAACVSRPRPPAKAPWRKARRRFLAC